MHQHYRHPSDGQAAALMNAAAKINVSPPSTNTTTTSSGSSASTIRRQSVPVKTQDTVEVIPSSNAIDSAMYERDKQIYKCSTMRPPGKPAIMNCPLPEIPKAYQQSTDSDTEKKYGTMAGCRTFQRNIKMAGLKPIQPPKIITSPTPDSQNKSFNNAPPPQPQQQQYVVATTQSTPTTVNMSTANTNGKIYSTGNPNSNNNQSAHQQSSACVNGPPQQRPDTITNATHVTTNPNHSDDDSLPPPPPPNMLSPIDDSNYAVTEL